MFGFLAFVWLASLIAAIISSIRRKGSKKYWAIASVSFIWMLFIAPKDSSNSQISTRSLSPELQHEAVASEAKAAEIASLDDDAKASYHVGLQHLINQRAKLGSYTIANVIQIGASVVKQQQSERDAVSAAQAAVAQKEAAHIIHGEPNCLTIDDRTLGTESSEYVSYMTGKAKNGCDRSFNYIQVEINIYKGDSIVGSTLANVNNVAANNTWSWKAIDTSPGSGNTWRVEKIAGF